MTMSDQAPRSALELAMERLRKKDAEAGLVDTPLTDDQKAAIAEARNYCEAKLAEVRILHESKLARTFEPEARARLEEEYRLDAQRLADERDRRIARIREGRP
jgi:AraC-like DNA-binding protein